ncbi:hypothetical protein PBOI14_76970 [Pseudomonas sp. Boi14]|nr:hypothetical protein PBOI14_76970 [Pseudomonas sp. Boi14]
MNEAQQGFFRQLLLAQRSDLQERIAGEFDQLREQEPTATPPTLAVPKSSASGNCACWSGKRSFWTRSTKPWSAWPVANTAGAATPASPSASSACCCGPPPPCVSKPKNAKSCANAINGRFDPAAILMRNNP